MSKPTFTLSRASLEDVPRLGEISTRAFDKDTHSQMKIMGQRPGAFSEGMAMGTRSYIESPRSIVFKATDDRDGTIVGSAAWGFRGVEIDAAAGQGQAVEKHEGRARATTSEDTDAEIPGAGRIKELENMTGKHLEDFMNSRLYDGCKTIFVCGVSVDPRYEGQGIGSQLMEWATDQADRHGAFMLVHSSEAGWPFYSKHGFAEVDRLTIDLDEWSIGPPPNDGVFGDGEIWGQYTFRYGMRQPVQG